MCTYHSSLLYRVFRRNCAFFHDFSVFCPGVYVYSLASQKNPPPLKFFPVFMFFLRSFKLHQVTSTCVLSLFSFFSFSLPFFIKSYFKFFPVFQWNWPEFQVNFIINRIIFRIYNEPGLRAGLIS